MANRDRTPSSPTVLIANDHEWSARSLESILGPNGYTVVRAYTGKQTLEKARAARPDVIILDAQLPDMHGFDVCRALRNDPQLGHTTPVIITTSGPSGRAQRLEAYRAGAWEFLGQPLDGEALLLKLQTFTASKLETDRLREEGLFDYATGLYNMRGLARRAREIGAEAARRHEALACVVFSSDPEAEPAEPMPEDDRLYLAERVAQLFRRIGRASDVIGRLGEAEFAVIAPATSDDGALRMIDRLSRAIEGSPLPLRGAEHRVRMRAGYCSVADASEAGIDATEILLRATTALRTLPAEGTSRVRAFETAAGLN